MIPPLILTSFDPQELEWLIAGQAQVDIADWKENTIYWGERVYPIGRPVRATILLHCIL